MYCNIRAARCGGAGLYVGEGCTAAYGGLSSHEVSNEVIADGELRDW